MHQGLHTCMYIGGLHAPQDPHLCEARTHLRLHTAGIAQAMSSAMSMLVIEADAEPKHSQRSRSATNSIRQEV